MTGSRTQDTFSLSHQCSAAEPQHPVNHQPSRPSIYTAQVVLNTSVAQLSMKVKGPVWKWKEPPLSWWRKFPVVC